VLQEMLRVAPEVMSTLRRAHTAGAQPRREAESCCVFLISQLMTLLLGSTQAGPLAGPLALFCAEALSLALGAPLHDSARMLAHAGGAAHDSARLLHVAAMVQVRASRQVAMQAQVDERALPLAAHLHAGGGG
jgi:hypothetical protein